MAINPIDGPCDKTVTLSHSSLNHYKYGNSPATRLMKVDYAPASCMSNLTYKHGKYKNSLELKSPYLNNTNLPILNNGLQLLSRVTEKRFVRKNGGNIMSSFPLAGNIYKVNSDELKSKQTNKKVLKSVLTLSNDSRPSPQRSSGSDMNDSEYFNRKDDLPKKAKRNSQPRKRKRRPHFRDELETQYCSDMNCSSNDTIKRYGDGKSLPQFTAESKKDKEKIKPHDVWAVLRNMNRFQFQTSPQLSDCSFTVTNQRKNPKQRNNRRDMRVFETRRTQEFAYISRYKVDKSPPLSHGSSFDQVTVIDKNQDTKLWKEVEDKLKKKKTGKLLGPRPLKSMPKNKNVSAKHNLKAITYPNQKKCNNTGDAEKVPFGVCASYVKPKETLNNNASVDLGYESKTTENDLDEDFISFHTNTTTTSQASHCNQSGLSVNSGSSKAGASKNHLKRKKAKPNQDEELQHQTNGITKVILSKSKKIGQPLQNNKIVPLKPPIHQVTVTPNYSVSPPKLTKPELSRQLHKYKFPIVILGKDQLASSIEVRSEHPQFDGLDQQIWPFMDSWYNVQPGKGIRKQINNSAHIKKIKPDEDEKRASLKNGALKSSKANKIAKIEPKRLSMPLSENVIGRTQNEMKLKPIRQLKDRMVKLLCKNSSALNVIDRTPKPGTDTNERHNNLPNEICTGTQTNCEKNIIKINIKKSIQTSTQKRPWTKARWASDIIENVMKKIKSGAYYNQDRMNKVCNNNTNDTDTKGVVNQKELSSEDIQKELNSDVACRIANVDESIPSDENVYESVLSDANGEESGQSIVIPGFDNDLPVLEMKAISLNEVAVKHCGANITVHFDVVVPTNSVVYVKYDSPLIPISITQNCTKVFKYRTSILNAMLPAELCTILPKMLSDMLDSAHLTLFTSPINDVCALPTISEGLTQSESVIDITAPFSTISTIQLAPELQPLLNDGHFKKDANTTSNFHILKSKSYLLKDERHLIEELKSNIKRNYLFDIDSQPTMLLKITCLIKPKIVPKMAIEPIKEINTCTALQPYPVASPNPISKAGYFNLRNLFEAMATYINNVRLSCFNMIKADDNFASDVNIGKSIQIPNLVTIRIDNLNDCINYMPSSKISVLQDTEKPFVVASSGSMENDNNFTPNGLVSKRDSTLNNNKIKRKGYVKLFRKCKSASHVSGEKVTPLDSISDMDDFLQALGSLKLSGVFDGQPGNKIMSLIDELKIWTTEINPKQALLLILLANKKESPNLLRYRPMLLQGIAVKRITKAIELEMETEVIERENLDGVSQFEGITYIPASTENQDCLYEELCWIAKNTASDYQKPFNHTSEKLLKSLLEKRKQLNPSYLRVMARYVGLGLLKTPGKRQWN